jgi:hypothetical protein
MVEADTRLWHDFQALAIRYPDCEAIRLVKNMQRAFIAHQQIQIARDLAATLAACRTASSIAAATGILQAPGVVLEGSSTA